MTYMLLKERFNDERMKWQDDTQQEIRRRLLQNGTDVAAYPQRDHKLVVVFGKPQVGKTTLILSLMGIAEERHREIGRILRAGIPEGNSSTSTATIYQCSRDDSFGICERNAQGDPLTNLYCCDAQGFQTKLQEIRQQLEDGSKKPDTVLYLYLPQYFFESSQKQNQEFSILDVPGYGSRNRNESRYVGPLLKQYMNAAQVNIVVRELNDINDLRHFQAPNGDRIERMLHRYIVVTTRSYSQESIARYFSQDPEQRSCSFAEYLNEVCDREFRRIFGNTCPQYFAVDVGQSFYQLLHEKITREQDRKELLDYRRHTFETIRANIRKRKGDRMSAWIEELREKIDQYEQNEMTELDHRISTVHKKLRYYSEIIKKTKSETCFVEQKVQDLMEKKQEMKVVENEWVWPNDMPEDLCIEIFDGMDKDSLKERGFFQRNFDSVLIQKIMDEVEHRMCEWSIKALPEGVDQEWKDYWDELQNELYQRLTVGMREKVPKGRIGLRRKMSFEEKKKLGWRVIQNGSEQCKAWMESKVHSHWEKKTQKIEQEIQKWGKLQQMLNRKCWNLEQKQMNQQYYHAALEKQRDCVSEKIRQNKSILQEYRNVAEICFLQERSRMISNINHATDAERALCWILLLGLICGDYDKMRML